MARKRGQIIARGNGRWLVCVSIGRDHRTRQRKYLNRTDGDGFRATQHDPIIRLEERDQAREPDAARLTLNQYLDRWLELAARPKLREKSYRDYQALLGRHIRPSLGERELSGLAPLDLQSVYHQMRASGLSPRTVHCTHAILRAALEQAVRWRLLERNPGSGVENPKPIRREMQVLDPAEARRFLEHAGKTRYGVLLALALTTGMRPSEYLALRWSDIDWQEETVTVLRTLEKGRGWKFADTKRARSRRPVKLESWVARQLRQLFTINTAKPDRSPEAARQIFKTRLGRPINSNYLARRFKQLLREAGLPAMRLYDLRHTAATLALAAGVPPKVVSEQLGHASSAFTLDVYSHVLPHMQAEAALRVEALLGMDGRE
ncbi:MAG: tyrosine-type recombinase/integrase [Terracidiphilus sp.]